MNKEQFVKEYKEFVTHHGLDVEKTVAASGGAMLMMGLREETGDIDLDVEPSVFKWFLRKGYKSHRFGKDQILVIEATENIDLHICEDFDDTTITEGVCHYTAEAVLRFKKKLNREKDQKDIQVLTDHLRK